MTRTEFIDALASETNMDKKDAKLFLDALTVVVEREIKAGGEIPLRGLGKFKVQHRKARVGRNPMTGPGRPLPVAFGDGVGIVASDVRDTDGDSLAAFSRPCGQCDLDEVPGQRSQSSVFRPW